MKRAQAAKSWPEPQRSCGVVICGSTGSIGTQALEICERFPDLFHVVGLIAGRNVDLLAKQAEAFHIPGLRALSMPHEDAVRTLVSRPDVDVVLNGIVGFAGLTTTLVALESGKRLALANKESLIAAGPLVAKARANGGGEIVPVDSEHSAIYQALRAGKSSEVHKITLTASGGPFRGRTRHDLDHVSLADALAHPTWNMGPKISVDSSTLMNKGLEVIEARELFGLELHQIEVVVHPESIIHGMVEFSDGATIAQMSMPDMRLPIGFALGFPDRLSEPYGSLNWETLGALHFARPDTETFRCLPLAYEAARRGEGAPALLNGANEVAVQAFLDGDISWLAIADTLENVLAGDIPPAGSLDEVLEADRMGRDRVRNVLGGHARVSVKEV